MRWFPRSKGLVARPLALLVLLAMPAAAQSEPRSNEPTEADEPKPTFLYLTPTDKNYLRAFLEFEGLYAVYDIGDKGVLEANKNTVFAFSTAFLQGEGPETVRASWIDVANRNFVKRLAHHALSAVDQGIFVVDLDSNIRYREILRSMEKIPTGLELLALTEQVTQ
jgi:hypothetical protein